MTTSYIIVSTTCPFCGLVTDIVCDKTAYDLWKDGMSIQDAMPDMTPVDREMLISGICPSCWDDMFGDEDEDEDEDLDWEDDVDECGFNPYMGCYDFDC
jgi:hypothetical protein